MFDKIVYLGADHGGYLLKEGIQNYLKQSKIEVVDLGTYDEESVDYPEIAREVAEKVIENEGSLGILVCGTGIGMSMTANKVAGIRAAVCTDEFTAGATRKHNNANVMCLGGRVTDPDLSYKMVDIFLGTDFEGGRHERRVGKIENPEK